MAKSRPSSSHADVLADLLRQKAPRTVHITMQARAKLRTFRGTHQEIIDDETLDMPEPWSKTIEWMADALEALGIDHRVPLAEVKDLVRIRLKPRAATGTE